MDTREGEKHKGRVTRLKKTKQANKPTGRQDTIYRGPLIGNPGRACQRPKIPGTRNQRSQREGHNEKNTFRKLQREPKYPKWESPQNAAAEHRSAAHVYEAPTR